MRALIVLLPLVAASCAPVPPRDYAAAESRLAAELAGRAAGPSTSCIPDYPNTEIDSYGRDLLFRTGDTIYVNRTGGGCESGDLPGHTYVIDRLGGAGNLCNATNIRVVDSRSGILAGNCSLGEFVPYRRL